MKGIKSTIKLTDIPMRACEYLTNQSGLYGYIDTGVTGLNTNVEMKFSSPLTSTDCLWCSRNGTQSQSNTIFIIGGELRFDYQQDGAINNNVENLKANKVYTVMNDGNKLYLNGVLIFTSQHSLTSDPYNIFLFDSYMAPYTTSHGPDNGFEGNCYYCKMWKDNALVRDFVPVYRTDTKEYGLFDKVEGKFYGSGNSDKFTGKLLGGGE